MGTAAAERHPVLRRRPAAQRGPVGALVRRAFADGRIRTISFAYLFAALAYIQPASYRTTYPTPSDRLAFAHSFGDNKAVRLFYGVPRDLLTVGGYTAWRVGGTLAIFAAVWGLLAAVRALRAEEDSGRRELVLAGIVSRRTAYITALTAVALGIALLWVACFAALVLARLPAGPSAYLALAVCSVIPVFVGVGALASQLAPTRRLATELSAAVLGLSFVLRVVADTSSGLGGLRWASPLGWVEELRPFTGATTGRPAAAGRRERRFARHLRMARRPARRGRRGPARARRREAAFHAAVVTDRVRAARRAPQSDDLGGELERVRAHHRRDLCERVHGRDLEEPGTRAREARQRLDPHPPGLHRVYLDLLRADAQPVRVCPDRRSAS